MEHAATKAGALWDVERAVGTVQDCGRQHRRASLHTEVHLGSDSNFYAGISNDVSAGGLFVATRTMLARGTVIDLEFSLPDGGPAIRSTGVVRWLREERAGIEEPPGMGVQFVELEERARRRLERFVELRDTIYFDDDLF